MSLYSPFVQDGITRLRWTASWTLRSNLSWCSSLTVSRLIEFRYDSNTSSETRCLNISPLASMDSFPRPKLMASAFNFELPLRSCPVTAFPRKIIINCYIPYLTKHLPPIEFRSPFSSNWTATAVPFVLFWILTFLPQRRWWLHQLQYVALLLHTMCLPKGVFCLKTPPNLK